MRDSVGNVRSLAVLGGGSEIGLATARAYVERGARTVVLAARRPERLEHVVADLRQAGAETVDVLPFDADDPAEAHAQLADSMFHRHGDIDLVIAAAGVLGDADRDARDGAAAREVLTTNFAGLSSALLACAERMRSQGHGTLVVLSSVAAERARRSNFVYGASKAGLDALAQGLGDSLHGSGVQVVVVRPGFVHTKMTAGLDAAPLSTTPDAVAAAIVDGVARGAHTVWVPGALRWLFAVLRHLPRAVFRRLDL